MAFSFKKMPAWRDIHIDSTPQRCLLAIPFVFTVLATATVVLRLHSRRIKKAHLGADDWFCLLALLFAIATVIMDWIMVFNGSGTDLKNVGRKQFLLWIKLQVATYLIWMCAVAALQISILAFYTRTFGIYRTFRFVCFGMMAIVAAWFLGAFCSYLFSCKPIHKLWDTLTPGKCTLGTPLCASVGMLHIILDASILIMPIPQLWRLQMAKTTKAVLTVLLMLGVFATTCAIIRLECIVKILPHDLTNPTSTLWLALLFQFTEVPVGIICICVPTLRPVARNISQSKYSSMIRSLFSSHTSSQMKSDNSKTNMSKPTSDSNSSVHEDKQRIMARTEFETRSEDRPSYENLPDFPQTYAMPK